jgi:sugar-specific transcriptional regulator TrmB
MTPLELSEAANALRERVYQVMKELEDLGFVEATLPPRVRGRKYRLTQAGTAALEDENDLRRMFMKRPVTGDTGVV